MSKHLSNPAMHAIAASLKKAGYATELEFKFHPDRRYRADLAIPSEMILVECDGGIFRKGGGAHTSPTSVLRDMEKSNLAHSLGFTTFRCTPYPKGPTGWPSVLVLLLAVLAERAGQKP